MIDGERVGYNNMIYSESEIERIARVAGKYDANLWYYIMLWYAMLCYTMNDWPTVQAQNLYITDLKQYTIFVSFF